MAVAIVIVVVAFVALLAGGLTLLLRRREEHPRIAGEPPAPPQIDEAPPTPSVEELEALLEAPTVPEPVIEAPAPEVQAEPEVVVEPEVIEKPKLRDRLSRTRGAFAGAFRRGRKIDDETWDDLEEALLLADVGMNTTTKLFDAVKSRAKSEGASEPEQLMAIVRDEVSTLLTSGDAETRVLHAPDGELNVWMFVGVNGVGKTTTIGKLASQETSDGQKVLLVAADTFRAAAADQLELWAKRTGAEIVRSHQDDAQPASVVFDGMAAANSRDTDLVLVDTAGRLHTKSNLMEELRKMRGIVDRTPGACKEVLLVIDASTGQNGLTQAKQFAEAVDVTGIVLTKLDGTAKGGIVLAIQSELGIPVKVVGVGEGIGDLIPFDPSEFAAALFEGDS